MNHKDDDTVSFDPMGFMRAMSGAGAEVWMKLFVQLMNSEEYARATGALLDTYLTTSEPFRSRMEKLMIEFVKSDGFTQATRQTLDAYLATTSPLRNVLLELMRSEAFAEIFAELLDHYLASSSPFRELLETAMLKALTQFMTTPRGEMGKLVERLDPSGTLRKIQETSLDTLNSVTALWRETSAEALHGLASATPFQQAMEASMTRVLTQLNMPTRNDVTDIAARLEQIEQRLERLESQDGSAKTKSQQEG